MKGTVVRLNNQKAFGFIHSENPRTNGDYFFHREDFEGHWNDLRNDFNQTTDVIRVEFIEDKTPKGPRARNVKRLDHPNQ